MNTDAEYIARLESALKHATVRLAGAASAYRKYAARHSGILPPAEIDPFFTTRVADLDATVERAREVLRS